MLKNLRWTLVLLLFPVYMINYLDRIALSLTVPLVEKDLMINAEQFGLIFGSFFFGYALFNFIGGLATDIGPTIVLRPRRHVVAVLRHDRAGDRFLVDDDSARAVRHGGRSDLRLGQQSHQRLVPESRPPPPWAC